jgi:putative transposase
MAIRWCIGQVPKHRQARVGYNPWHPWLLHKSCFENGRDHHSTIDRAAPSQYSSMGAMGSVLGTHVTSDSTSAMPLGLAPPMHRKTCRRVNAPGHAHGLTFSCYRRLPLLSKDRTRRWLIESIDAARDQAHFDVWAYVIMPEHVHVLVYPRRADCDVSEMLWRIKRPVGRKAIEFLKKNSPGWLERLTIQRADGSVSRQFWQVGGGFDSNLIETETLMRTIDYFHLNPVRRGMVDRPEEWEWSSARWYAGLRPVPLEMDSTLPRAYQL